MRGVNRIKKRPARLPNPWTATIFLFFMARSAVRVTRSTGAANLKMMVEPRPETSPNSVLVGPGQRQETVTLVDRNSSAMPSEKWRTKPLVAW